ncbi:MAG: UTP--glucose-1-phosphate uridylyltransferase, partial [Candidatus Omnitrophota bacterium]
MKRAPCSHILILIAFLVNTLGLIPIVRADEFHLPAPGVIVRLSPPLDPPILKGIKVHPDNPFRFDFILDQGDQKVGTSTTFIKEESTKLIKYFLASLTVPEANLWVNLSPYEKDRIIPEELGQTELGRDMLAQDYILKQLTASLIYPEKQLGKEFWSKVYAKAKNEYGATEMPVNTFNKVWIIADKADVYVHDNTAFVVGSHLKVMLEEDYLALSKHEGIGSVSKATGIMGSQIIREIVLPGLEKEVNGGKNFANLRQIFHSMILATWYKKNLKEALLNQVYSNKAKLSGVDVNDKTIKEQIYQEYLKAYKKGVFNYIKEEPDLISNQKTPRKYFSGGITSLTAPVHLVGANNPEVSALAEEMQKKKGKFANIRGLANNATTTIKVVTYDDFIRDLRGLSNFTIPFEWVIGSKKKVRNNSTFIEIIKAAAEGRDSRFGNREFLNNGNPRQYFLDYLVNHLDGWAAKIIFTVPYSNGQDEDFKSAISALMQDWRDKNLLAHRNVYDWNSFPAKFPGGKGESRAMISAAEAMSLGFSESAVSNIAAGIVVDEEQSRILRVLAKIGEQGLLSDWPAPGTNDDQKRALLEQLSLKDQELQGGLEGYKELVRNLLKNAKDLDPTEGYTAQVPQGKVFDGINQDYLDYTDRGIGYLDQLALVKVAGGAGDRLGYNGPKVGIPVDLVTGKPFLQKDAEQILAKQKAYFAKTGKKVEIPFIIMTSDKTHDATIEMLKQNNFYGLRGYSVADSTKETPAGAQLGQVVLIRQNMVPLVKDMKAGLYKESNGKLGENPRGHGDIHEMLYRSGLVKHFKAQGKGQLLFYQDTNVETWNAILPLLANAVERNDDMNLVAVKRKPGEATGIVMTLIGNPLGAKDLDKVSAGQGSALLDLLKQKGYVGTDNKVLIDTIDAQNNNIPGFEQAAEQITAVLKMAKAREGKVVTRNVEYNYIKNSPALKAVESQYAGNINVFTMKMDSWLAAVEKTKGQVPFLLNPKTKPGSEELAKPMRAENNMQDGAVWFDGRKVGVTNFDARFVFAALKNDYPESYKRLADGVFLESPFAVEGIHYQNGRKMAAQMAGVSFSGAGVEGVQRTIPFEVAVKEGEQTVAKPV